MIAASIVSTRRFRPSVDQTRSQVEDQQAARAASVAAAERVKVAALLAARTGDFQDTAEALGIDEVGNTEWEYGHVLWGEFFPTEDEETARIAASLRPVGKVARRRNGGTWEEVTS